MAGNTAGGKKAAATNKERHGDDFYSRIGRLGGLVSTPTGGFAAMSPEKRREAGRKGGHKSSRLGIKTGEGKTKRRK